MVFRTNSKTVLFQFARHSRQGYGSITRIFICFFACLVISTASYSADKSKLAFGQDIDDEQVAHQFISLMHMYAYLNGFTLIREGRAKSGIMVFLLPGIVEDGKLNFEKLDYLPDNVTEELSKHNYVKSECRVIRLFGPWRELQSDGTLVDTKETVKRTFAIMDTRGVTNRQKFSCSIGGLLMHSIPENGNVDLVLNATRDLTNEELVKGLLSGELVLERQPKD